MQKINIQLVKFNNNAGQLVDFEDKFGQQTGKPYTRFKTNIGFMSVFDTTLINQIKPFVGQCVSVEIEQTGKYKNIKALYGAGDANNLANPANFIQQPQQFQPMQPAGSQQIQPTANFPVTPTLNKDLLIIRQCCVKAACQLVGDRAMAVDEKKITDMAEVFEKWVWRGLK